MRQTPIGTIELVSSLSGAPEAAEGQIDDLPASAIDVLSLPPLDFLNGLKESMEPGDVADTMHLLYALTEEAFVGAMVSAQDVLYIGLLVGAAFGSSMPGKAIEAVNARRSTLGEAAELLDRVVLLAGFAGGYKKS